MAAAAPAFQALSDEIRSLIASCPAHAPLLSRLQDLERERLRMTLALYALQAPARLELFAWQQNDGSPLKAGQGCGCGSGDGHSRAAHQTQEPTEAEFRAAVRELTCGIEVGVMGPEDALSPQPRRGVCLTRRRGILGSGLPSNPPADLQSTHTAGEHRCHQ